MGVASIQAQHAGKHAHHDLGNNDQGGRQLDQAALGQGRNQVAFQQLHQGVEQRHVEGQLAASG